MTAPHVQFRALGVPAPQGSKIPNKNGGMRESAGAKLTVWRQDIARAAAAKWGDQPPITTPIELVITFRMPRPKSRRRAFWCATSPDLDKLLRAAGDALTQSGVIDDDNLIVSVRALKIYADLDAAWTGADITLLPAPLTGESWGAA